MSVFLTGTLTLATIYLASDPLDTPIIGTANPFLTDANGQFSFAAPDGVYDIVVKGTGSNLYLHNLTISSYNGGALPGDAVSKIALANNASNSQGAALVGYSSGLTYPVGSVGFGIKAVETAYIAADTVVTNNYIAADTVVTNNYIAADVILSNAITAVQTNLTNYQALISGTTGAAQIGYLAPYTGAVARTQASKNSESVCALDFGVATGNSAAANTSAMNAAILSAQTTGKALHIPGGTYALNTLSDITLPILIYGDGGGTILQFNTIGNGIHINPGVSNQRQNFTIRDLKFSNSGSVPAAFICNDYGLNILIDRCYFCDASATYAIVNSVGYGTIVRDCVFTDLTGTGMLLKDNNAVPNYSYVTRVENCDFTRCSVDAVEDQGSMVGPILFRGCIFENLGSRGFHGNTKGGGGYSWNIHFDGCYFESTPGVDIDLNPNGSAIQSYAILTACQFSQTPSIGLGNNSRVQINSCTNSGGNPCTISGSANAQAHLHNSSGFHQNGVFAWDDRTNDVGLTSYTPAWTSSGTAPVLNNGVISGKYTRNGQEVTAHIRLTMGSTTTFGTGNYFFGIPFLPIEAGQIGFAHLGQTGTADWTGWCPTANNTFIGVQMTSGGTTNNANSTVTNTVPFTWASTHFIDISISYITPRITFTGSTATNVLTLTSSIASGFAIGWPLYGAGIATGTTVTALLTGIIGQTGSTYSLSTSPGTIGSEAMWQ